MHARSVLKLGFGTEAAKVVADIAQAHGQYVEVHTVNETNVDAYTGTPTETYTSGAYQGVLQTIRKPHLIYGEGTREGDALAIFFSGTVSIKPMDKVKFDGIFYDVKNMDTKTESGITVYQKVNVLRKVSDA